ncbi:MAG: hypothetical protein WKF96_18430 [Solirubrobacteraceae bacterium]
MRRSGDSAVPTLDGIARQLDSLIRLVQCSEEELSSQIRVLRTEIAEFRRPQARVERNDAPLSAEDVRSVLGLDERRWVYDHKQELGAFKLGGKLAFPADRVEEVRRAGTAARHEHPAAMPVPRYLRDRHTRREDNE